MIILSDLQMSCPSEICPPHVCFNVTQECLMFRMLFDHLTLTEQEGNIGGITEK